MDDHSDQKKPLLGDEHPNTTGATTCTAGQQKPVQEDPLGKRILYILIGSTPIMVIFGLCLNLLYLDYVKNNYSFFDKSLFLSNIDSHVFETRVACAPEAAQYTGGKSSSSAAVNQLYRSCYVNPGRAAQHECFRYLNDFVVSEAEADRLIELSKKAFSYSPSNHHGFNTFDIVSGQLSNDNNPTVNLKKYLENGNIFSSNQIMTFLEVKDKVQRHIKEHFGMDNLYLTKPVVFTRLNSQSKKSEYVYWDDQIDHITSKPTVISAQVQFNTYVKEFLGSRFQFRNADNRTILSVQPKKARVLVYTAGGENEYFVEPMESGEYFFLRLSFTCDPNYELVLPKNEGFFKF